MARLSLSAVLAAVSLLIAAADGLPTAVDCGGAANFTDSFGRDWIADRFFSGGGVPGAVAEPQKFLARQETTLRAFPPSSAGKKSCYSVPSPAGRYYIRLFTVYDNYDSKLRPPSFDVAVEGTLVFSWHAPWPGNLARDGAYSDLFAYVGDGAADVCFYSIATDAPVIGSLELFPVERLAYGAADLGPGFVLVNYGRLACGAGPELRGPGFTNDSDRFGRVWKSCKDRLAPSSQVEVLRAGGPVRGADQQPNFFPPWLYESAMAGGSLEFALAVDTRLDYLLWFHFAEIDPGVKKGQRVFDVYVNGVKVTRLDVFSQVGGFSALKWQYIAKNLISSPLSVKLVPIVGVPLICGLENYAMVPVDLATAPSQVAAMVALKQSLRVPDRMGWNGDPCAPSSWDAWEGVTCHPSKNGKALVITQLDLGSQGLKGYISDEISQLSDLVYLNLSSNFLEGQLPAGLNQPSLVKLDLSFNQLTGIIPDSLGSPSLELVLLSGNRLEGQVPEKLYSIGIHGGLIDLVGNKGLCGVPSLPACPLFWSRGGLSESGKIAVGVVGGVVFLGLLLAIYCLCAKKKGHDYGFAPSQDLMSMAAKRNRYQRQKSLMLMEMESPGRSGNPSPMNPL
ncbi:di-glucose binding protein with Leucine-rich repeat domain-containing protein [Wolffia australiana]